jgi:hypothetical protein
MAALVARGPDIKDVSRVLDMVAKSKGSDEKLLALARQMAKSIGGYEKAFRRYLAALQVNYSDGVSLLVASIFRARFEELYKFGKAA